MQLKVIQQSSIFYIYYHFFSYYNKSFLQWRNMTVHLWSEKWERHNYKKDNGISVGMTLKCISSIEALEYNHLQPKSQLPGFDHDCKTVILLLCKASTHCLRTLLIPANQCIKQKYNYPRKSIMWFLNSCHVKS